MKAGDKFFLSLCVGVLLASKPVKTNAAEPSTDPARILFEQGVALMDERKFEKACPKLKQSLDIADKATTWAAWADCNMQWDHPAEALTATEGYLDAYDKLPDAKKTAHTPRFEQARRNKETLRALVASITVVAPDVKGFDVFIDEHRRGKGDSTFEFSPLNAGEHHVVVLIPGRSAHDTTVTLKQGENRRIEVPSPPTLESSGTKRPIHEGRTDVVTPPEPRTRTNGMRVAGFIAIGVGTAGLLTSGVTTAFMLSSIETIDRDCDSSTASNVVNCKTTSGVNAGNDAKTTANLTTLAFGVGAVGAIVGTTLLVIGKRKTDISREKSPPITGRMSVGPSTIGLSVEGVW